MNLVRHLRAAFDWRTFAVAGAFLTVLLVGFLIHAGAQAAHDSSIQQTQLRAAAGRRIDMLSSQIVGLQRELNTDSTDRGRLLASIEALSAQVRQLGGQPVATAPQTSHPSTPTPTRTAKPATPTPAATHHPKPHPKPSPTCTRLPLVPLCKGKL